MVTFSGIRIEPSSFEDGAYCNTPTLVDLALSLGQTPRFAGMTRRWWPVLLHLFVCQRMAQSDADTDRMEMLLLFHDAHEAITGDVAAFWKPKQLSEWQGELDERIFGAFGLWPISKTEAKLIKQIDDRALRAEALVVGPPAISRYIAPPTSEDDVAIVYDVLAQFPHPDDTIGLESTAAQHFYALVSALGNGAALKPSDTSVLVRG